jgi:hypothetical protein
MVRITASDKHLAGPADASPTLCLYLLGGFRAERAGQAIPDSAWPRRIARNLVKLLAAVPDHRPQREQIQDLLWPELDSVGHAVIEGGRR